MTEENKNINASGQNISSDSQRKKRMSFLKRNFRKSKDIRKKTGRENKEGKRMSLLLKNITTFNSCISSLSIIPEERTLESVGPIIEYLKTLRNFMNTLLNEKEEEIEKVLLEVSSCLKYEYYEKNKFICKYGDKADNYYLILKGKVVFIVPNEREHYMTEEEYIEHLLKLRKKGEIELIKNILIKNQLIFYFGEDFDEFILSSLDRFEKKKENIYSIKLYKSFYEFRKFKEKEKNNLIKKEENIDIDEYIKISNIDSYDDSEYAKVKSQKLLTILEYQKTNLYEEGDSFGALGANSRSNRRSATSISYENCYLGVLSKKEYIDILEKINSKQRDHLFNLILSIKLFHKMTKNIFINNYIHMFHFIKYEKNDIIMNDNQKFDKMIIFYKGEFTLSINKNILELYDLAINLKRIKGKLMNKSEEKIKRDLREITTNKLFLMNLKQSSQNKNTINLILKRQYFIISEIKANFVLGYPNTVDPITNLPLFNCICFSDFASGYKIENEMLKYIAKDNYLRSSPPEITITQIDVVLNRLLELKNIIYSKIIETEKSKNIPTADNKINNINYNSTNDEKKLEDTEDFNQNNKDKDAPNTEIIVTRNENPQRIKNTKSVLFDFHKKIISNDNLMKTFSKNKNQKSSSNKLISEENEKDLNSERNKESLNKFYSVLSKMKKHIIDKEKLLKKCKLKSHRFQLKEKLELNQIQMKINRLKSKEEYSDLSNIFSKAPISNKAMLDKFEKIESKEDNVYDPIISDIKRKINYDKKISNDLIANKRTNDYDINNLSQKKYIKLFNLFYNEIKQNQNDNFMNTLQADKNSLIVDNKSKSIPIKNLKNRTKFSMSHNNKEFSSLYKNNVLINNKETTLYQNKYNLSKININDVNLTKANNNYYNSTESNFKDLHNMLYFKHIIDENKIKNYQSLSMEKNRKLNFNRMSRININTNQKTIIPSIVINFKTDNNFNNNKLNNENNNLKTHYENGKLNSFSEEHKFPFIDLLALDKLNTKYTKNN